MAYVSCEGVETNNPERPFIARITVGTKKNRNVLAEFEAPSLPAAQRDANDWMAEYCARVGIGGAKYLDASAMRSRWDRLRDGMPNFPEPGAAYCAALRALAFDLGEGDAMEEPEASKVRRRRSYPSRARIVSTVVAARAVGIDVAGVRIWADGSIAVFDPRSADQPPAKWSPASRFDGEAGDDEEGLARF